jgi:hypothetical protein
MLRRALLLLMFMLVPVQSCASKDAVAVSASLANPQVAVAPAPGGLVSTLAGSFDVNLELGARASEATEVTFSAFSIVRADNDAQVLNVPQGKPLSWVATPPPPIRLNPGGKATMQVTIGTDKSGVVVPMELPTADKDQVCGAGQLKIVGTIQDSANGAQSTPVSTQPFLPSGC